MRAALVGGAGVAHVEIAEDGEGEGGGVSGSAHRDGATRRRRAAGGAERAGEAQACDNELGDHVFMSAWALEDFD